MIGDDNVMKYKETLKIAEEVGVNYVDLMIAKEVDYWFMYADNKEFEMLCEITKDVYLKSDEDVAMIQCSISRLINKDKKNIKDITRYDVIHTAQKMRNVLG